MKKLLYLLILIPLWNYAQDSDAAVDELPRLNSLAGDSAEYFYILDGVTDKHFLGASLVDLVGDSAYQVRGALADTATAIRSYARTLVAGKKYWNLIQGGSGISRTFTLYPRHLLKYANVWIGSYPGTSRNTRGLTVDGTSRFTDTATFENGIKLGDNWLYDSLGVFWFRDNTSGLKTIADLLALPTSLTGDWTLNKSTHDIVITDGLGNGISWIDATNVLAITSDAYINLDAPYTLINDSAYIQKLGTPRITTDTICIGDSCYVDMPSGGSGGPGGTYVPGCLDDKDTAYIVGYDSTDRVKYDLIPTVPKGEESIHFITINFTAANVNDGDTLEFVPEQGVGKIIVPIFLAFHYEGSTSVSGTNDCALMYGNSNIQYIPFTDLALDSESTDFTKNIPLEYYRGADCSNQALNFRFGADLSGTNRSGWFKLYYSIVNK